MHWLIYVTVSETAAIDPIVRTKRKPNARRRMDFWSVQSIFIDFLNETTEKSRDCSLIFVHILDAIAAFPLNYLWVYICMPWMVVFTFTFFYSSVHDTECCSYIPHEMNENAIIIITIIIMLLHLTNIYIYEKRVHYSIIMLDLV